MSLNAFKRRFSRLYIAFRNLALDIFGGRCVDVGGVDLRLKLFKEVGLLKRQRLILHLGINVSYLFRASSLLFCYIYRRCCLSFDSL